MKITRVTLHFHLPEDKDFILSFTNQLQDSLQRLLNKYDWTDPRLQTYEKCKCHHNMTVCTEIEVILEVPDDYTPESKMDVLDLIKLLDEDLDTKRKRYNALKGRAISNIALCGHDRPPGFPCKCKQPFFNPFKKWYQQIDTL